MTSLPRLVAIDLDGTLLDGHKRLTPRTIAAVRAVADAGVVCVIASGRMYRHSIKPYLVELGLSAPVIAYNGAVIVDGGTDQILFERPVEPALAEPVLDWCAAEDRHLQCYFDDVLYCRRPNRWSELYLARTGAEVVFREDLFEWVRGRASTKLLTIDEPPVIEALLPRWRERLDGQLYVTISEPEYLEFMDPGATKGWALRRICELLDIPPEETAAFGDSTNDLPLLEAAGHAVAMAGARPALLAAADTIAPPHEEDGVAQVLERWLKAAGR